MNQQSNMDQQLKQLENQSIPDMSRQDDHWQEMKKMLRPEALPSPKKRTGRKLWFWLAAACITGVVIYFAATSDNGNKKEPLMAGKKEQPVQVAPHNPVKDTLPTIIAATDKENVQLPYRSKPSRTSTNFQVKAKTQTGKDTVLEARLVDEPKVVTKTDVQDPKASLAAFFTQLEKPVMEYVIDNRKDTVIWGSEGTALLIPANTFNTKGNVTITLREFYSYKDIITHKLNTSSDGEQLITGGMLHLTASINGKQVDLPPSKSIRWFLPDTSANMEDMQLFVPATNSSGMAYLKEMHADGMEHASSNSINWRPSQSNFNRHFVTMSIKAVDLRDLPFRISSNKKYKGFFFINNNSEYSRNELRALLEKKYPYYDKIVIAGKRRWKETSPFVSYDDNKNYSIGDTVWFLPIEVKVNRLTPLDTITYTANSSVASPPALNNQLKKVADKYSVEVNTLGWVNADKFYKSKQQKVQYVVNLDDAASNYNTFIVFDRIKSMIAGNISGNKVIFSNVPAGEKVKVISVGVKDGKTVSAMAAVELANTTFTGLRFEPTDPNTFREQAATLDE